MGYLLGATLISFGVALGIVWHSSNGATWGQDSANSGPQKVHSYPVPRLGGVAIFASVACCVFAGRLLHNTATRELATLLVCSLPALAFGLAEDITGRISSRQRLVAAGASSLLGVFALGAVINRVDIALLDSLLGWAVFSVPLTIFAVTGVSNSINIIDGFNGLAAMVAMLMFAAIGYVAHTVGDQMIVFASLSCGGAILGFFIWNFPLGLIFLGDGGAYFLGFMLAELAVLLFLRHPEVSPWFAVLVFVYPIVETAFSIYRRRVMKGVAVDVADATHLHSLIFRRLLRATSKADGPYARTQQNSMTSPYLWLLCATAVLPASMFWQHTPVLILFCVMFLMLYLWIYRRIVRFKTPAWLRQR